MEMTASRAPSSVVLLKSCQMQEPFWAPFGIVELQPVFQVHDPLWFHSFPSYFILELLNSCLRPHHHGLSVSCALCLLA